MGGHRPVDAMMLVRLWGGVASTCWRAPLGTVKGFRTQPCLAPQCGWLARSKTGVGRVDELDSWSSWPIMKGTLREGGNAAAKTPRTNQWTESEPELGGWPLVGILLSDLVFK